MPIEPHMGSKQCRDDKAEAVLEEGGYEYAYKVIQMSEIDTAESRRNHGRLGGVKPGTVEDFVTGLKKGNVFPALVARKLKSGTYVLAGGNTRHAAMLEAKRKTVLVMEISCTDKDFFALAAKLNDREGDRNPNADRIHLAAEWVEEFGASHKAAAKEYNVSIASLARHIRTQKAREYLEQNGFTASQVAKISIEALAVISKRSNTAAVSAALARLVLDHGLTADALRIHSTHCDALPSEKDRTDYLEEVKKSCTPASKTKFRSPMKKRTAFIQGITRMENLVDDVTKASQMELDKDETPELRKRWQKLIAIISTILDT